MASDLLHQYKGKGTLDSKWKPSAAPTRREAVTRCLLPYLPGGDPRFARVKREQKAFGSEVVKSPSLRMTKTVVPYRMYGSTIQTSPLSKFLPLKVRRVKRSGPK